MNPSSWMTSFLSPPPTTNRFRPAARQARRQKCRGSLAQQSSKFIGPRRSISTVIFTCQRRNEPDARFRCVEFKTGKVMWDVDEAGPSQHLTPGVYGAAPASSPTELIALGEGGILGLNPSQSPQEIATTRCRNFTTPAGPPGAFAKENLSPQRRPSGLPEPRQIKEAT